MEERRNEDNKVNASYSTFTQIRVMLSSLSQILGRFKEVVLKDNDLHTSLDASVHEFMYYYCLISYYLSFCMLHSLGHLYET